jgi:molybdopterin-containing oxidoreductase family membrane subunit
MWDVMCLLGSFGLFFTMFCLFVRFLPMVATAEVKTVLPQADPHWPAGPEREIRGHRPGLPTPGEPETAAGGVS